MNTEINLAGIADPKYSICIHQWFEEQAGRTPDTIALTCEGQSLTYRELNAQANQLAHWLQRMGVGPEVPVALCLERSLKMVVAILGVLKAGGAYVPMDPAFPQERLDFMLKDTQAPVLVTVDQMRGKFASAPAKLFCMDAQWNDFAAESKENLTTSVAPNNIAYIIYTSGSTGKPKGVLVTHQNVARLFQQTEQWYGFNASDVWTLFHSYTFDFSVWEIWGALLYGGRLVVVPYFVSRSPAEFYELLAREKVTVLNQTPSAFRQLLWAEVNAVSKLPLSLRYVIFGGEALELQSLKPWFERHGDQTPTLVNMYGITETTVHVTYRPIRQTDLESALGSVIGVPIPDLRIHLLDENLAPVETGVPGEICIAGAGVARGYLNRPELTAQRFIADPICEESEMKMYRSGDLARYNSNGELEYLGRMDHQVKIRGFRVELGEIESVLNTHPALRESVVIAADSPDGNKRLVAYFVPRTTAPSFKELRDCLAQRLPDYMIPTSVIPLSAILLTSNGKVDRRALPSPETEAEVGTEIGKPQTATEVTLSQIWCELLNRPLVSTHESFFHLGGHSLLAAKMIWRIRNSFNVEIPLITLFEASSITKLAQAIDAAPRRTVTSVTQKKKSSSGVLNKLFQLSPEEIENLLENPEEATETEVSGK